MIDDTGSFVGGVAGGITVTIAAVVACAKIWWRRWQQQKLERFKIEHQAVFTRLHERRADAIEEIYAQLTKTFDAFQVFMSPIGAPGEDKEKEREDLCDQARALHRICGSRIIHLSPEVAGRLTEFNDTLRKSWIEYLASGRETGSGEREHWAGWEMLEKEAKPLKAAIEKDFRNVLGILNP